MAAFPCPSCRGLLHLEDYRCPHCAHGVAYRPAVDAFLFLPAADWRWHDGAGRPADVRACTNAQFGVCNWLVEPGPEDRCVACRHNRVIPDLSVPGTAERWWRIEAAKHRLVRSLLRLGLPLENRADRPADGLAFDFLYDADAEQGWAPTLPTGHAGGLITLNLVEADDVARERIRRDMGEPYRTLLGHFRHEVGHHFWSRLVEHGPMLAEFRALFGDERQDYAAALRAHHARPGADPAAADGTHVSDYATAHPWEDFAETFAHFLHITETLATMDETALALAGTPPGPDPFRAATAALAARWIPATFALNAVNRSMGLPDLYPFRLGPAVLPKLDFVNRMCAAARA